MKCLTVNFAHHDVEGSDHGRDVGQRDAFTGRSYLRTPVWGQSRGAAAGPRRINLTADAGGPSRPNGRGADGSGAAAGPG